MSNLKDKLDNNKILELEKQLQSKEEKLLSQEKEIKSQKDEINKLKDELIILKDLILNKNRKIFGQSSEKVDSNQLSIFNEAEKESDPKKEEPTIEEITYTRKKADNRKTKSDNLANLDRIVIEHKLEKEEQKCPKCEEDLVEIGTKTKEILKYEPAKLYIEEHVTYSYACKNEECEEKEGKTTIVSTEAPKTFLNKSIISNELASHVIYLKYQQAMPLYRQENYFQMMNVNLSRQTLSNTVINSATEFEIVYDLMKEELIKTDYIQADETTVQVINEQGKDAKSKKYMWLYKTGEMTSPIIIYDYQKTRSSSCPRDFLEGFSGYLQTDGYTGYNKVENINRLYCLAHIRRKYYEIVSKIDKEALDKSKAIIGFNYCEQLYAIEKELRQNNKDEEDYYEKRYKIRLEKSAPIIEKFMDYVEKEIPETLPRSPLGKALIYTQKTLPSFRTFLEDGRLEIDNNGAERSIKPFVIGRKNWQFSNTKKGARSSAILYSIIETAKANGLLVEKYLVYLMNAIAIIQILSKDKLLEYMPWSETIPDELKNKTR